MRLKMDNKTYILAIFAALLTFLGQAEANMTPKNLGNPLEGLNVLKMGPLDPRENDGNRAPLPNDDASQDAKE